MKKILIFKHKLNSKSIKEVKKPKRIGIVAASRKLGVTHMCLAIGSFLSSALKQKVLYIEVCDRSQLLPVVGEKQISFKGHTAFEYKKVTYVLACSVKEAMELMNTVDRHIVLDIDSYNSKTDALFSRCDKKIVIGSMKPWCRLDMLQMVKKLEGGKDYKWISYFNIGNIKNEAKNFYIETNKPMGVVPFIENPFKLKETDFVPIINMIL